MKLAQKSPSVGFPLTDAPEKESRLSFYKRWGRLAGPYFEWQIRPFLPYLGKRVADIGCGLGNFTPFLEDRELYLGLEPEPELRREFGQRFSSSNIKLADHGDITTPEAVHEIESHQMDSILCVNVLEHIKEDGLALSNMVKGIQSDGHLCLLVPALPWLYGTLDEMDGHYRRYTKKGLLRLAREEGVEVVKIYYSNLIGALGWFFKGKILKEKSHGDENFTLMNKILPFVSFTENIVKPFIGMSLVMVVKKI